MSEAVMTTPFGFQTQEEVFIVDDQTVDKKTLSEMKKQRSIRLIQETPTKFRTLKRIYD